MALNNLPAQSGNPAWKSLRNIVVSGESSEVITRSAIAVRVAFLLAACMGSAAAAWIAARNGLIDPGQVPAILMGAGLTYLALGLVIAFKPGAASWLATPAVTIEGAGLGLLTMVVDARYPGIGTQALLATLVVGGVSWGAYASGLIKPGARFVSIVQVATLSVVVLYAADLLLSFWMPQNPVRNMIGGSSLVGIGFSLLMVGLAAMNLVVDYMQADALIAQRAPKNVAWYAAWAVMVTLIWLYVEMLRLLMKLNSRR